MFCSKCGREVGQDENFCPKCGAKFEAVKMPRADVNKNKPTKYIIMIVGMCIVMLVVIGVLIGFFRTDLKSDNGDIETAATSEKVPISVAIDGINYCCYESSMTAEVTQSSVSGSVVIPATIEVEGEIYQVTSIGEWAFNGCSNMTSVELPDGLLSIGRSAFHQCYGLINVEMPKSIVSIGKGAFLGCNSLTSIELPDGVTTIEYETFFGCDSLTSVDLPEGLITIGERAFMGCDNLERVDFPEGLITIETYAFDQCYYLLITKLPSSLVTIEEEALWDCALVPGGIVLPEGLVNIEEQALPITRTNATIKVPRKLYNSNSNIKDMVQNHSSWEVIEDITEEVSNTDYYYRSDFINDDEYERYLSLGVLSGLK